MLLSCRLESRAGVSLVSLWPLQSNKAANSTVLGFQLENIVLMWKQWDPCPCEHSAGSDALLRAFMQNK